MSNTEMERQDLKDLNELKAGTGFMIGLAETIRKYEERGYTENLVPRYDHFEARSGEIRLNPEDFVVDKMVRFENTSDPDDQSVLYLVSAPSLKLKGLFVEAYGTQQDELSRLMIEKLKDHNH
ncbi:MAG: hypothetical protein KF681_00590 [Bdellovibrionaceae bacterium]|nr:hypothetical protein [Pseudobdellovibrionaceae bacterium]